MLIHVANVARKQAAFFKRGLVIDSSYRMSFVLGLVDNLLPLVMFFFLSKLVDHSDARFAKYGSNYFGFVCLGVALNQYFSKALSACGGSIRRAQTSGVLESTLSTQTSPHAVVLYDAVYQFAIASLNVVFVLLLAKFLLGLDLSQANWTVALVGFLCASTAFLGLSVFSAGVILRIKDRDVVQMLLGGAGSFLAGAYFPLSLMPRWLQILAQLIPMTHALEVLRGSILAGEGFAAARTSLLVLAAMSALSLPIGIWFFSRSVAKARRDGSLLQY